MSRRPDDDPGGPDEGLGVEPSSAPGFAEPSWSEPLSTLGDGIVGPPPDAPRVPKPPRPPRRRPAMERAAPAEDPQPRPAEEPAPASDPAPQAGPDRASADAPRRAHQAADQAADQARKGRALNRRNTRGRGKGHPSRGRQPTQARRRARVNRRETLTLAGVLLALLVFFALVPGSPFGRAPRPVPTTTPTWSYSPVPSRDFTVGRAVLRNPPGWTPVTIDDATADLRNASGDRITLYVVRLPWYWSPGPACVIDVSLASQWSGSSAVGGPLPVLALAGAPAEGLWEVTDTRTQAAWCAKPDPRAAEIYEVVLDARGGSASVEALRAYRTVLATWSWVGEPGPTVRPTDRIPEQGTPVPSASPGPLPGGRLALPRASLAVPDGWSLAPDSGLLNGVRLVRGGSFVTVDLAGERTTEAACDAQLRRLDSFLGSPGTVRPAPTRTPSVPPGPGGGTRSDGSVSDGTRAWHVACVAHGGATYLVTAGTKADGDPRAAAEAVLATWRWS